MWGVSANSSSWYAQKQVGSSGENNLVWHKSEVFSYTIIPTICQDSHFGWRVGNRCRTFVFVSEGYLKRGKGDTRTKSGADWRRKSRSVRCIITYQCYTSPTEENIKELILQIAHKEIVQKSRYIAQSWQNIFCHVWFSELFPPHSILNFYKSASPTGRKVVAFFEGNCQTDQEKQCLNHLKR